MHPWIYVLFWGTLRYHGKSLSFESFSLSLIFSAKDGTRGLAYSRVILFHWIRVPNLDFFKNRLSNIAQVNLTHSLQPRMTSNSQAPWFCPLNSGIISICHHIQLLLYSLLIGGTAVEFILKLWFSVCGSFASLVTWQCLEGIFTTKIDITSSVLEEIMDTVEYPTVPNIASCNVKLNCQHQSRETLICIKAQDNVLHRRSSQECLGWESRSRSTKLDTLLT